jgi:hypothetical protein
MQISRGFSVHVSPFQAAFKDLADVHFTTIAVHVETRVFTVRRQEVI